MITAPTQTKAKSGVGFSQKEDSFDAGVEIANQATANSSLFDETLFLLFATPHHKVDKLIEGVRSVTGDKPRFLGCTTTGLVTTDFISYTGALVGGTLISSDIPFKISLFQSPYGLKNFPKFLHPYGNEGIANVMRIS